MDEQKMPKTYEAARYEDEIYLTWEQSGFFNPDNLPGERTEAFSMVLPPPNVTGTLHLGHAVMLAIEDTMVRYARMQGKRALWIPGTDHAAIATQTKVEKLLIEEGMQDPRRELGREAFLERVDAFAKASHDTIVGQAKKMGASLDWSREAYTLDASRHRAVNEVFGRMYNDGLIYRGDRMVNWCPRCKSTLADDEVEYKEETTKFYYFKYGTVVIGTARPETKFLDKVIVVHPDDERYREWVGKEFEVEWIDGPVKATMIADEAADMEMGSGAMTITPAHSVVDFELAQKYGFDVVKIIGEDGCFTSAAGSFAGKNAHASREEIVARLQEKGLVDHVDDNYVHNLSVCYRCDSAIEPLPKVQWFIDVNKPFAFRQSGRAPIEGLTDGQQVTLKQLMGHVVRTKQIEIVPDRFEKTYFHWIDNLRDWNISRQIWFGHRVPVWYRKAETVVSGAAPEGDGWEQDPDTLDTWFSSGLWTFSTLGWPEKTKELEAFHPTHVLETGYDILFFWVARMILMSTYVLGEVPFRNVYLHGLVRDEKGRKMSKSIGNVIDPLETIEAFGADATRLALVIGSTPGNDSKLSHEKIAGFRNFTNKLWNISRFVLSSVDDPVGKQVEPSPVTAADHWILDRFEQTRAQVTADLDAMRYSAAGEALRDFTWNDFADWYIEAAKIQREARPQATDALLLFLLKQVLVMWHPFMPFVTEQIWKSFETGELLMVQSWPQPVALSDTHNVERFEQFRLILGAVRQFRNTYRLDWGTSISELVIDADTSFLSDELGRALCAMGKIETVRFSQQQPEGTLGIVVAGHRLWLPIDHIDLASERVRVQKEIDEKYAHAQRIEKKLANDAFVAGAPKELIDNTRAMLEHTQNELVLLRDELDQLSTV